MNQIITLKRPDISLIGEIAGRGPDLLLLHAGGETRRVWAPVVSGELEDSFRCIRFDQRGHGDSGGSPADGIQAYGRDTKAMIDFCEKPVVVGSSLGGFALMLALRERQEDVAGLVLVDVVPAPDPEQTRAYLAPRGNDETFPLIEDILSRQEALTHIVRNLTLPILLVSGGRSPITAIAREAFQSHVPHARNEIIKSAGHLVARDAPDALASCLKRFMEKKDVQARYFGG